MEETPLQRLRRLEAEAAGVPAAGRVPSGAAKGAAAAGVLGLLLTKGKFLLLLLGGKLKLLLGALKLGPLWNTAATMGLSLWFYAGYFGAALAAGFLLLILVHELGHGYAARRMGLKVGAPIFIPFLGAVIALKDQPRSTWVEAVVALAGPVFGGLGGLAVLLLGFGLPPGYLSGLCRALAHITFHLNLFNLIPVMGLDGDRATQPCRWWYWPAGAVPLVALAWAGSASQGRLNPVLLFLLVLGGIKAFQSWRKERGAARTGPLLERLAEAGRYQEEGQVTEGQRQLAGAAYFALATTLAGLSLAMDHLQAGALPVR
ncbi:MAG: site-2 protease family protein [Elusimicrobia bacterium]|nr:site-2 protease family protein [Elusimicrobiota bacterium]